MNLKLNKKENMTEKSLILLLCLSMVVSPMVGIMVTPNRPSLNSTKLTTKNVITSPSHKSLNTVKLLKDKTPSNNKKSLARTINSSNVTYHQQTVEKTNNIVARTNTHLNKNGLASIASATAITSISINGNADFTNQAITNGWPGSGIASQPYIIANYKFNGTGAGTGIFVQNTDVYFTLVNDTVSYFDIGFELVNVTNGLINSSSSSFCNSYSYYIGPNSHTNVLMNNLAYNSTTYGFYAYLSNYNNFNNNSAYNISGYGFNLGSSNNNIFTNNSAFQCQYGFYTTGSSNNLLANNNVSYNSVGGLFIYSSSNNNTVNNNRAFFNGWGIMLSSSSNNTLISNEAYNNTASMGIDIGAGGNNTLFNNTISFNNQYGIYIASSNYNIIANNSVYGNKYTGFYVSLGKYNVIANNSLFKNLQHGLYLDTAPYNHVQGNVAFNNTQYGFVLFASNYTVLSKNFAYNNTGYGFMAQNTNGSTYLENSASMNGYDGFNFGAQFNGNFVINNTISYNIQNGITFGTGVNNQFINNTISNNTVEGLYVNTAKSNYFINNTLFNNPNGVHLLYSTDNVLISNRAYNNTNNGFIIEQSSINNTLISNTAFNNGVYGFESVCNNTYLLSNVAYNNTAGGIYLSSSNNTLIENTASFNGNTGIVLSNSYYSVLSNNTVFNNTNVGIVLSTANNNTLSMNIAFNNYNGFQIQYSNNNTLTLDTAYNNTNYGIYFLSSSDNYLIGETAFSNGVTDIYFDTSSLGNIVSDPSPVFTNIPALTSYVQGSTGNQLSWTATDNNPSNFTIYRNGTTISSGSWSSGTPITVTIDGLSTGVYNFTIVVRDYGNQNVSSTLFFTVITTAISPTFTNKPLNQTITEGTIGNIINWTLSDDNPDNFTIFENGTIYATGGWSSGTPIPISIDGLSAGVYNFTIVVEDFSNLVVTDSINITVLASSTPQFTALPSSTVTFNEGSTGNILSWTIIDDNPNNYTISQNGVIVQSETWTSGTPITINIDNLKAGSYTFEISVLDKSFLIATDTVSVTVSPSSSSSSSPPQFTSNPPNIVKLVEGSIGNNLSWTITDANPDNYTIFQDGNLVQTGTWTSGTPLTIKIDNLKAGSYYFKIVVQDKSGVIASNTVQVEVFAPVSNPTTTSSTSATTSSTAPVTFTTTPLGITMLQAFMLLGLVGLYRFKKSHR